MLRSRNTLPVVLVAFVLGTALGRPAVVAGQVAADADFQYRRAVALLPEPGVEAGHLLDPGQGDPGFAGQALELPVGEEPVAVLDGAEVLNDHDSRFKAYRHQPDARARAGRPALARASGW